MKENNETMRIVNSYRSVRVALLLVILFCSVSVALCETKVPVHFAVSLPLTGPAAAYGNAARNGFILAKERFPAGFERIEIHFEDHQIKPSLAVTAYSSLRQRYPILAHYDFGSATSLALAPIAAQRGEILISSAYDPAVSKDKPTVYRFANTTSDYAKVLLDELRARKFSHYTLVVTQNAFFEQFATTFKGLMNSDERVTILEVSPSESDISSIIPRVRQRLKQGDALGLFMFTEQALTLLDRLAPLERESLLFGTDSFEELASTERRNPLTRGLIYPNNMVQPQFIRDYEERFKTTSHITFAASTYELALLLAEIVNKCGTCTTEHLMQGLESTTTRYGAMGEFRFTNTPIAGKHFPSNIVLKPLPD